MSFVWDYTLLHNRLIGFCMRLEKECRAQVEPDSRGLWISALGVIILADASLEIGIHHKIETSLPPREIADPLRSLFRFVRLSLWKRKPPLGKLEELARILGVSVDWKAEPWRSARDLHTLRNALAHFEADAMSSDHPDAELFPRRSQLEPIAQRIGTADRITNGWLTAFLNPICATWAYNAADAALRELDERPGPWNVALSFYG
jgi:hypothetical protein